MKDGQRKNILNSALLNSKSITSREGVTEIYLKELTRKRLLSGDDEKELAERVRKGDAEAEAKLVEANMRFVVTVAKTFNYPGVDFNDLIQQGNIGLLMAVKRFEPSMGVKFISYAVHYIRLYIKQFIDENGTLVRVPANHKANLTKINRFISKYYADNGVRPTPDIISDATGIEERLVADALDADKSYASLSSGISSKDGDMTLENSIASDSRFADHIVSDETISEDLRSTMRMMLTERDARIMEDLYGLNGREYLEEELADKYGLTTVRIQQIRRSSLGKLHKCSRLMEYIAV